jgi:hypothetical protein
MSTLKVEDLTPAPMFASALRLVASSFGVWK